MRTRVAKSYDIDTIVDHAILAKLGAKFQLSPSDHISGRKFELKVEGAGVDVYPVYQSKLGQRLQIPVEVLITTPKKSIARGSLLQRLNSWPKWRLRSTDKTPYPVREIGEKCGNSSTPAKASTSGSWLESCEPEVGRVCVNRSCSTRPLISSRRRRISAGTIGLLSG